MRLKSAPKRQITATEIARFRAMHASPNDDQTMPFCVHQTCHFCLPTLRNQPIFTLFCAILRNISPIFLRYWKIWAFRTFRASEFSAENFCELGLYYGTRKSEIPEKCRNIIKYGGFSKERELPFPAEYFFDFAPGACFLTLLHYDSIFYVDFQKCSRNFTRKSRHHRFCSLSALALFAVSQKYAEFRAKCDAQTQNATFSREPV